MIRLRIPKRDDPFLYQLILKRLVPFSKSNRPDMKVSRKSTLLRLAQSKVFVVVKLQQAPFGFISVKIKQGILFIDMLAVDSSGENKGWGSKLMLTAERYGRLKGCQLCRLWVDENNDHAQQFYTRKGYTVFEYVPLIRCYMLGKNLK